MSSLQLLLSPDTISLPRTTQTPHCPAASSRWYGRTKVLGVPPKWPDPQVLAASGLSWLTWHSTFGWGCFSQTLAYPPEKLAGALRRTRKEAKATSCSGAVNVGWYPDSRPKGLRCLLCIPAQESAPGPCRARAAWLTLLPVTGKLSETDLNPSQIFPWILCSMTLNICIRSASQPKIVQLLE